MWSSSYFHIVACAFSHWLPVGVTYGHVIAGILRNGKKHLNVIFVCLAKEC